MALTVKDVAEIMEHWQEGTGIKATARILRRSRDSVRKYVRTAQAQGYRPGGNAPKSWETWAAENFGLALASPLAGEKALKWEEYVPVAERYKYQAESQDRDDLRQDIIVRLAEVAIRYQREGRPFTKWTMFRVARITVMRYWHELSRHRRLVILSSPIGDGPKPKELGETLADKRAIDLDAWLDAKNRLRGCPPRLLEVAYKRDSGIPLGPRDCAYLKYYRNKAKQRDTGRGPWSPRVEEPKTPVPA